MNINRFIWSATTFVLALLGALAGWGIGNYYIHALDSSSNGGFPISRTLSPVIVGVITLGLGIVAARCGSWLADRHFVPWLRKIHQLSAADRVLGIVGALLGLVFGALVSLPFYAIQSKPLLVLLQVCVMTVSAAVGMALMLGMRAEMLRVLPQLHPDGAKQAEAMSIPKLMDTNVIIDGRIADLCKTGFIEGPIYVPHFVLEEVQYIADSSDSMRRARGRRGLEVLNVMREIRVPKPSRPSSGDEPPETIPLVHMLNEIPPSVQRIDTVDSKLLFLAKEMGGSILTNDFNLNRVAEMQGVPVLNINELAQALKPVVLPGEELTLTIVKEGKEPTQGVGYLEDGTMVVVGDGASRIGDTLGVVISSVYQTLAGKMIFADLKGEKAMKGSGDDLFGSNGPRPRKDNDDYGPRPGSGLRRKGRS